MHKTGPWSSDMPISLLFPLETGKFPEETTFVVFAMFFFLLLSPLAEAYLSAVPLDISGSQKYMMTGGLVV